jgi:hypothetical protein
MFLALRAKEAYAKKKWEYYTRSFEKVPITGRAEWLRESDGWMLFLAEKLNDKTCILSLVNYLGKSIVLPSPEVYQDCPRLDRLASLAKEGLALTEEMIEQAVARKPHQRHDYRRRNVEEDVNARSNENA